MLRGLHFQVGDGIGKLVRGARGAIFDVVVDLRGDSPTYGQWERFELDDRDLHQLWVPVGFAHGFYTRSEFADVIYRQTGYYDPALERAIAWNDPAVGVVCPLDGEPRHVLHNMLEHLPRARSEIRVKPPPGVHETSAPPDHWPVRSCARSRLLVSRS